MEFFKIGEHAVCCFVTASELEERDIHTGDFIKNTSKLQEFLQSLIEQASKEVSFEMGDDRLAVQVMPLPGKDLFIAFSDSPVQNIVEMMDRIEQMKHDKKHFAFDDLQEAQVRQRETSNIKDKSRKKIKKLNVDKAFYCFNNMDTVEAFCKSVMMKDTISSQLYKDPKHNQYYLKINKGRLSVKKFEAICAIASEFAQPQSLNRYRFEYIEEHMECLIPNWAIRIIKKIS